MGWADLVCMDYADRREECCLKPQRMIEEWYAHGKALSYEDTHDVLEAMYDQQRYEEILALCREFEASGASASERCHAVFFEGMARLKLMDLSGIDVLYQAARLNRNYVAPALDTISTYCCALGLEEDMERFRQFRDDIEDDFLDHQDIFPLTEKNHLEVSDLSRNLNDENLTVIRAAGGETLEAVYLVKKIVSQRSIYHIYILKFREGTEDSRQEQTYDKVFMHLDKQDEDYALTVWVPEFDWLNKHPEFRVL